MLYLLLPVVPLAGWYAYHYLKTGFLLGNPEFYRYNVAATINPLRIPFAFGMRLWQVFGYFGLYLLTLAGLLAMLRPAQVEKQPEKTVKKEENSVARPRNSILDAGSISLGAGRLPGLYVGHRRSGAGSLHAAGRPSGDSDRGLDALAARALLEINCGRGGHRFCRGTLHQSTVWIFSRG